MAFGFAPSSFSCHQERHLGMHLTATFKVATHTNKTWGEWMEVNCHGLHWHSSASTNSPTNYCNKPHTHCACCDSHKGKSGRRSNELGRLLKAYTHILSHTFIHTINGSTNFMKFREVLPTGFLVASPWLYYVLLKMGSTVEFR